MHLKIPKDEEVGFVIQSAFLVDLLYTNHTFRVKIFPFESKAHTKKSGFSFLINFNT